MVKKEIRKEYIEKRKQLPALQIGDMSEQMIQIFTSLQMDDPQTVLSYYPIPGRQEFNVGRCEEVLRAENEAINVAWPKLQADMVNMEAVVIRKGTVLMPNRYSIPEPYSDEVVNPQLIDIVFVPLLAFDKSGYRVGYGKGYYDRYLVRCRPEVIKIGFSFFEPLNAIDDINEFDVPLNYCITPMRGYEF